MAQEMGGADAPLDDRNTAEARRAFNGAVRMLGQREHSAFELSQKLQRKFPALSCGQLNELLDELKTNGWLSDERFTESLIRGRVSRGYGPFYITRELASKGVSETLVEQYLSEADIDWQANAASLVERRYPAATTDFNVWEKAARYLQRRGHTSDTVRKAVGVPPERPR